MALLPLHRCKCAAELPKAMKRRIGRKRVQRECTAVWSICKSGFRTEPWIARHFISPFQLTT